MKLIERETKDKFKKKHPASRKALDRWVKLIRGASFKTPVDFFGNQAVFNVGGNKIRAITKYSTTQTITSSQPVVFLNIDKNKSWPPF